MSRFALWPEPVDHDLCFEKAGFTQFADSDESWDADFESLAERLLHALRNNGTMRLVSGERAVSRTGLFRRPEVGSLLQTLIFAAQDDQFPICILEFGQPASARISVGHGHPIFWVELLDTTVFPAVLNDAANKLPVAESMLQWEMLLPERFARFPA